MSLGTLSSLKKFQVQALSMPRTLETVITRYGTVLSTEPPSAHVVARATGVSRPRNRRVVIVKVKSKFAQRLLRIS